MFKTIYKHLKSKNIDVYSIGQHIGVCEASYVVIKNYTPSSVNNIIEDEEVELFLYGPVGEYTKFIDFISEIKKIMNSLNLKDNEVKMPIIVEDGKKAYVVKLSYSNIRKKVL